MQAAGKIEHAESKMIYEAFIIKSQPDIMVSADNPMKDTAGRIKRTANKMILAANKIMQAAD